MYLKFGQVGVCQLTCAFLLSPGTNPISLTSNIYPHRDVWLPWLLNRKLWVASSVLHYNPPMYHYVRSCTISHPNIHENTPAAKTQSITCKNINVFCLLQTHTCTLICNHLTGLLTDIQELFPTNLSMTTFSHRHTAWKSFIRNSEKNKAVY